MIVKNVFKGILDALGYKIVPKHHDQLLYIHEYEGGYDEYKKRQIHHNKMKIDQVWADDKTLGVIRDYLNQRHSGAASFKGICHGARNGYEVKWFRDHMNAEVIGTDISDTASDFPNMVTWDFHDENPEWAGRFDFVYTNSLDQAMKPAQALRAWAQQINEQGVILVEHTMLHSAAGAGAMDPFGAHPMCLPYLFFKWGRGVYQLEDILEVDEKQNKKIPAWVFVLGKV